MESNTMTKEGVHLGALATGELARIRKMQGGHGFLSRLASLGFTPGAHLRVIQNYGHGPIIVSLRDSRIALGRGEAQKILVERLEGGDDGR